MALIPYVKTSAPVTIYRTDYKKHNRQCPPTNVDVLAGPVQYSPRVQNGYYLPGYAKIIKAGGNATTNYDALFVKGSRTPSSYSEDQNLIFCDGVTFRSGYSAEGYDSPFVPDFTVPSQVTANGDSAKNQALSRLISNVADELSPFNGLVFIGELGETIRLLRNPLQALRKGLHDYSRNPTGLASLPKSVTPRTKKLVRDAVRGTYLEATFGWIPLARDIQDLMKVLDKPRPSRIVRVHGSASITLETEEKGTIGPTMGTIINGTTLLSRKLVTSCNYVAGIRVGSSGGQYTAADFGLAARNFVPALWNLLPWSFVVDYFTNIGDIANASSIPGSSVAWTSSSTKNVTSNVITGQGVPAAAGINMRYTPGSATGSVVQVLRRDEGLSLPLPSLQFELPNLHQIVNLTALADQLNSSHRKLSRFR